MFEAQAIAIEIEKIVPNRPMTHDLFKSFADKFGFTVREIVISDLREGIFFARIVCTDGTRETVIDARPSDAIAIGIRFNVQIYTYESILSEAGITTSITDEAGEQAEDGDEGGEHDHAGEVGGGECGTGSGHARRVGHRYRPQAGVARGVTPGRVTAGRHRGGPVTARACSGSAARG